MKLVSWNVNGIRSAVSKGLGSFLEKESPDVLAVQETKLHEVLKSEHLDKLGYVQYINPADKKGYSGTSIFTRKQPICTDAKFLNIWLLVRLLYNRMPKRKVPDR